MRTIAELEARVALLEGALTGYLTSEDEDRIEEHSAMERALASDGTSALAAVRLAQRLTRLLCRGGNLYDLPEQVEAALAEAFGSGE